MSDRDRLYFRQLLAGRDFASHDPHRSPDGQLRVPHRRPRDRRRRRRRSRVRRPRARRASSAPTACACTGVLATHWHPDHVGGDLMGYGIEGIRELLGMADIAAPVHVHRDEAEWVKRTTGVSDSDLVRPRQRRRRDRRRHPGHADAHARSHAGEPVLHRRRQARRRRHAVPRGLRSHRPARRRSRPDVREPHAATRRRCPTTRCCIPATCTPPNRSRRWARRVSTTTCSASTASTSGACSWAGASEASGGGVGTLRRSEPTEGPLIVA